MRPYLHELVVSVRSLDDREQMSTLKENLDYRVNMDYYRRNAEPATAESILTIKDLIVPARSELVIFFGIKKNLLNFEKYPNDPSRGFNVMQMPVLYKILSGEKEPWRETESGGLLVQMPEPDFSMPFNVLAVTNAMLGIFFINIFNVLVKPKRLLYIF
jgi:hypothetical protein